jgi:hypothetical protein
MQEKNNNLINEGTMHGDYSLSRDDVFLDVDDSSRGRVKSKSKEYLRVLQKEESTGSDIQVNDMAKYLRGRRKSHRRLFDGDDELFLLNTSATTITDGDGGLPIEMIDVIDNSPERDTFDFASWFLMTIVGVFLAAFVVRYKKQGPKQRHRSPNYEKTRFNETDLDHLSTDW